MFSIGSVQFSGCSSSIRVDKDEGQTSVNQDRAEIFKQARVGDKPELVNQAATAAFETDQAEHCWNKMKASFIVPDEEVASFVNQLFIEVDLTGIVKCFSYLASWVKAEEQRKFKIEMTNDAIFAVNFTFSFDGEILFKERTCPRQKMAAVMHALSKYGGEMALNSNPSKEGGLNAKLFYIGHSVCKKWFKAGQYAQAAEALFEMSKSDRTIIDDIHSCNQLVQLDKAFKRFVKITITQGEGYFFVALTIQGKSVTERILHKKERVESLVGVDFSYCNLQGSDLMGVDLSKVKLRGADLRGAKLKGADLADVEVQGAQFDGVFLAGDGLSETQLKVIEKDVAATQMQTLWRAHRVRGTKAHPGAMVPILKGADGKPVEGPEGAPIYKVAGHWVAFPKRLPPGVEPVKGSNKSLTHRNDAYVGLTFHPPAWEGGEFIDPSKPDKAFHTFTQDMLKIIQDNKLVYIVPQIRVNQAQLISKNLGSQNLFYQARDGDYQFAVAHFKGMAADLDRLHQLGIVLRDIKPPNMAFFEGHVYLFDLDTMGEIGNVENGVNVGTINYLHPSLQNGFYGLSITTKHKPGQKEVSLAILGDRYAFFISMLSVSNKAGFSDSGAYHQIDIQDFVKRLPCSDQLKKELEDFLLFPLYCPLFTPLSAFL